MSLAVKCASPIQGKPRMNHILISIPFGCNIIDILQEIACSMQEYSCLKGCLVGSRTLFDKDYCSRNLNMKTQMKNN